MAAGSASGRWLAARAPAWLVPGIAGIAIVQAVLIIAQAALLAAIIAQAILHETAPVALRGWLIALLLVLVARAIIEMVRGGLTASASARIRQRLRPRLFERMSSATAALRGQTGSGALAVTLVEQVDALDPWFARFLPQRVTTAVLIPAILIAVFIHDWLAGLLLMISAPLIPLFMILIGIGAESLSRRQQLALTRLSGVFLDRLRGLDTIRRYGAEASETERVANLIEDFRSRTMAVLKLAFVSTAVLEFFSAVAIAVIAIYVGMGLLGYIEFGPAPELTLQSGLFVLLLAPEFFLPLRQLSQSWHDRAGAQAAAQQIRAALDTPAARPEPPAGVRVPVSGACRVEARRLTLTWPDRGCVLEQVSLIVEPGERVLIAGPSGSGKSTLLHVLAGFIAPDQGSVQLNGTDLARVSQAELARIRGWMGQQTGLFDGSIADNIRLGYPAADERTIGQAMALAGVAGFVRKLPAGMETCLTQDGEGLSAGQARRIALARALTRERPLLLLDEPTASLDADTAAGIWETLRHIAQTRNITIICASHDAAGRAWASRRFELSDGRLTEGAR